MIISTAINNNALVTILIVVALKKEYKVYNIFWAKKDCVRNLHEWFGKKLAEPFRRAASTMQMTMVITINIGEWNNNKTRAVSNPVSEIFVHHPNTSTSDTSRAEVS